MSTDSILHATIHFSGRVQGVGFRYTVFQLAKGFEVTGFVQNLADGRVLLEAEGSHDEVVTFVAAIEQRMSGFIRKLDRADRSGIRVHSGFTIR